MGEGGLTAHPLGAVEDGADVHVKVVSTPGVIRGGKLVTVIPLIWQSRWGEAHGRDDGQDSGGPLRQAPSR